MESKEVKEKGKNKHTSSKKHNKQTNKKFQVYKQGEIVY
jgi:hypothetical protein